MRGGGVATTIDAAQLSFVFFVAQTFLDSFYYVLVVFFLFSSICHSHVEVCSGALSRIANTYFKKTNIIFCISFTGLLFHMLHSHMTRNGLDGIDNSTSPQRCGPPKVFPTQFHFMTIRAQSMHASGGFLSVYHISRAIWLVMHFGRGASAKQKQCCLLWRCPPYVRFRWGSSLHAGGGFIPVYHLYQGLLS